MTTKTTNLARWLSAAAFAGLLAAAYAAAASDDAASEPADKVFVPTEDISEDFAVPFPVDI